MTATAAACCPRVGSGFDPFPGSIAVNCRTCGAAVWLHRPSLINGIPVDAFCPDCLPRDGYNSMVITGVQVEAMRARGADDFAIARAAALCVLTYGNPASMPAMVAEINRHPFGPTAVHYRGLVADVFVTLAGIGR
jgi:hypothetical protein